MISTWSTLLSRSSVFHTVWITALLSPDALNRARAPDGPEPKFGLLTSCVEAGGSEACRFSPDIFAVSASLVRQG